VHLLQKRIELCVVCKISGEAVDCQAGAREFALKFRKPIGPTSDEQKRTGVWRELPGKLRSDARRSPGDEGNRAFERVHAEVKRAAGGMARLVPRRAGRIQ
jgi:hypothetical protein